MSSYLKYLSVLILLSLTGCASETVKTFTPFAVEVRSQQALSQDLNQCRRYAQDYLSGRSSVNPSQVAQEGLRQGFSDLGYLPLAPIAPALGALGGASDETLSELGLNSQEARKIITICLHDKGEQSNSYHIYDPNN